MHQHHFVGAASNTCQYELDSVVTSYVEASPKKREGDKPVPSRQTWVSMRDNLGFQTLDSAGIC